LEKAKFSESDTNYDNASTKYDDSTSRSAFSVETSLKYKEICTEEED